MTYITGGVKHRGLHILTKKELRRLIAEDPALVTFYCTSDFGSMFFGQVDKMPDDAILVVTGPYPYTDRRWHANLVRDATGKVRVS